MRKINTVVKAAVAAALMATVAPSYAATIASVTRDFAREVAQPTTVWTLPTVVYTMGVASAQDFYITFTLTNAVFTANPTAAVSTGGSATRVDGGVGSSNVTFRIDGATFNAAAGDTITLNETTATSAGADGGTSVTSAAANGLLFIGGAVASPLESVTPFAVGADIVATFTQAVTITMAADSDPIDLNPANPADSRKVFGPAAQLDLNVLAGADDETTTKILRLVTIAIGAQREPDNTAAFGNTIDTLGVQLGAGFNTAGIASLCLDVNYNQTCDAAENFNLTTGAATIGAGTWVTAVFNLNKTAGANFDPRTLTLNYQLNAAANAIRPGMTAHTYTYTGIANNTWPIVYANGTLLRSAWFTNDPNTSTTSTMRLVNAGAATAAVVSATFYTDQSGSTASVAGTFGVADIPPLSGKQVQLNPTNLPGLGSTSPTNRAYLEVILAGDLANVDGAVITFNTASGTRTVTPMRNVTFDTGVRTSLGF